MVLTNEWQKIYTPSQQYNTDTMYHEWYARLVSQDIINNTSTIEIVLNYWAAYGPLYYNTAAQHYVIADGTWIYNQELRQSGEGQYTSTPKTRLSTTGVVHHEDDGTKTFSIELRAWFLNQIYTQTISGLELPAIPRASKIELSKSVISGGDTSDLGVTITKYVDTYTDTVKGNILDNEFIVTGNTIPYSQIKGYLDTAHVSKATLTVTVTTKDGDAFIGENTASCVINISTLPYSIYDDGNGTIGFAVGGYAKPGYYSNYLKDEFPPIIAQEFESEALYVAANGTYLVNTPITIPDGYKVLCCASEKTTNAILVHYPSGIEDNICVSYVKNPENFGQYFSIVVTVLFVRE